MIKSIKKTWPMLFAAIFLLAGCSEAGNDGGDSAGASDPTEVEFGEAADTASAASSAVASQNTTVSTNLSYFSLVGVFALTVDSWDGQEGTYTYGGSTYTVSSSDNRWSWTFTYEEGSETTTASYVIERTSSGWTYEYGINDAVWFEGITSADGLTGSMTYYDYTTGERVASYDWEPASSSAFYLTYTITSYSDGSASSSFTISTSQDGSSGEWSSDTDSDGTVDDSGTW